MSDTKVAKPPVIDAKGNALELGMRVIYDETAEGKTLGTITGLEYQRQRIVAQPDGGGAKDVRPALKVRVEKNRAGKIQRVQRAVRASRKAAAVAA